jgi:hypothetical protein
MTNSTPAAELGELARAAAWGLAKGGHLDSLEDGKGALVERLNILEAAERAGIYIDLDEPGTDAIYTGGDRRPFLTTLVVTENGLTQRGSWRHGIRTADR